MIILDVMNRSAAMTKILHFPRLLQLIVFPVMVVAVVTFPMRSPDREMPVMMFFVIFLTRYMYVLILMR